MEFDTFGNKLTPEQIEYFKNTQIKDGDKLMVCQHVTSDNTFKKFDIRKSVNSKDYGIGFYFSANDSVYQPDVSLNLKAIYCYLNIERLITDDSHYISDEQWQQFLEAIDLHIPFVVSSTEGEASVYSIISQLYANQFNDLQYYLDCVNNILKVDGSLYKNVILAFRPEQIKFIDNKKPTKSENMNEALDYMLNNFWR